MRRAAAAAALAMALCGAACNAVSGVGDYDFEGASGGAGGVGAGGQNGCPQTPCKLTLPQCGCDDGLMCTLTTEGRACVTEGQNPVGTACSGNDGACAPGLVCVSVPTGQASCRKVCTGDNECEAPGGLCVGSLTNGTISFPDVVVCTESCVPTTNAGCTVAGMACRIGWDDSTGIDRPYTQCVGSGQGQQGDVCMTGNDCAPTLQCVTDADMNKACLEYCEVGGNGCNGTLMCVSFIKPAVIGGTEYGACL